jgi:ketosteroid isomerase-like protein
VPEDNVDRFHRLQREWQERRSLPPELLSEDVEWVNPPDAVEPGTRRGAEGFNEAIASIYEGWEESVFVTDRVVASGDDVVAVGELRVRGRAVGVEVRREHGQIWTFRDGRVTRMRWFGSGREALEAAGLSD